MQITFKCKGMILDADINITPFVPAYKSGHPDTWMPEEGGDIEFVALECEGSYAMFLLQSSFRDEIEMAALDAAFKQSELDKEP